MTTDKVDTFVCDDCGDTIPIDESDKHVTAVGETVCDTCRDDNWCEVYGDLYPQDDCVWDNYSDEFILASDAFCCDDCGDYYHFDNGESVRYGDRTICRGCYENGDYVWCEDVDTVLHIDDAHYSESDGCWYAERQSTGPLYCYSTDVLEVLDHRAYVQNEQLFGSNFGRNLVFGVELETSTRDNTYCSEIVETLITETNFADYGICKEDGSVDGPELVTLPADLRSHKETYTWDAWCEVLRPVARGHYGYNNGIHVHINRGAVSPLQLGKMLVFMNARENADYLSMIAQRNVLESQWCGTNPHKFDKVVKSAQSPRAGKYSILNVTPNTVEVRMFNSSLLPERIYKNIEFCHALVLFARNHTAYELNPERFTRYVNTHTETYPHLAEFINDRSNYECV